MYVTLFLIHQIHIDIHHSNSIFTRLNIHTKVINAMYNSITRTIFHSHYVCSTVN